MAIPYEAHGLSTYGPPMGTADWNAIVVERINALIRERGIKQEAIAATTGFAQSKISRLKNGEQPYKVEDLIEYAAILEVSPADLLPTPEEITEGRMQPRKINRMRQSSDPGRKVGPQLTDYLERRGYDLSGREQDLLLITNPVPGEGEDADAFFDAIIDTMRRSPPKGG